MKHILALIAIIAMACLGQPVRAAQENHAASITTDGIHTTGKLPSVTPSFSVVAIEGRRAPDNPGIVMLDQTVVCPKCIDSIGAPVANGTTFNWRSPAPDNPTIEVVIGSHGLGAAWSSPSPYDPLSPITSLVTAESA